MDETCVHFCITILFNVCKLMHLVSYASILHTYFTACYVWDNREKNEISTKNVRNSRNKTSFDMYTVLFFNIIMELTWWYRIKGNKSMLIPSEWFTGNIQQGVCCYA